MNASTYNMAELVQQLYPVILVDAGFTENDVYKVFENDIKFIHLSK